MNISYLSQAHPKKPHSSVREQCPYFARWLPARDCLSLSLVFFAGNNLCVRKDWCWGSASWCHPAEVNDTRAAGAIGHVSSSARTESEREREREGKIAPWSIFIIPPSLQPPRHNDHKSRPEAHFTDTETQTLVTSDLLTATAYAHSSTVSSNTHARPSDSCGRTCCSVQAHRRSLMRTSHRYTIKVVTSALDCTFWHQLARWPHADLKSTPRSLIITLIWR